MRTAALLAQRLRKLGFEVTDRVGRTGLVAVYRNGPGPVMLVRTELDALLMEEKTGLPFASRDQQPVDGQKTFVAHSCGHDLHMAWWIGTAQALLALKDRWHGTLVFVGQPAEEALGGAKAMIDDRLFTRFPAPDYLFAAHVAGGLPAGKVMLKDGMMMSGSDALEIVFNGRGSHGSAPQTAIDPIVMGSQFVSAVQTVVSRRKDPAAFGVITVGTFQAGSVGNIIPDSATLKLSVRSFTPAVHQQLLEGVERIARATAEMAGAPPPTISHLGGTAALSNNSTLVQRVTPVFRAAFGDQLLVLPAAAAGVSSSDDFSAFGASGVASLYMMIGGTDPKTFAESKANSVQPPANHSPLFAPDPQPSIRAGVLALTLAVLTASGS